MILPLLHTKLMPPRVHATLIQRDGLLDRLEAGLAKKITLVSAPTGFGKTTLVGLWLAERKLPYAWVSLEANDNDPVRFWTYVITALRKLDANLGKTALALLTTTQQPSIQTILTSLINELAQLSTLNVLVLEDYQSITAIEIHESLAFFLQHKPDELHLVIISRSEPELPLGILRVRDELAEIKASDLRFNTAEVESFLQETLKRKLPPSALAKLYERTEGWAAGLRLASLWLQNKDGDAAEQLIQSFSGSHRYVADYLIREVFESQPDSIQNFLLKTCYLNRLTGTLCDALTGSSDGEMVLEQLDKDNLFLVQLEQGRGRTWYRYSPLFAESIQTLARQRLGEAGLQALFEKASAWYAYQQIYDEAIETALAAGLYEHALDLIEKFIEIYNPNETGTLTRWMERIPQALILARPTICMLFAQVILFWSDRFSPLTAKRMEPYLQAAEQVWHAQDNEPKVGTVLALRGMLLLWQGEFQKSLQVVYQALEKMPEDEVFWRGVSLLNAAGGELLAGSIFSAQDKVLEARALLGASQNTFGLLAASGLLSDVFFAQGDLELCSQLCQQILAEALGDDSMLDDQGNARLNLARVAYEQNDLEMATSFAAEAFELGQQRANELLLAQAAGQLALISAAKGELSQARADLKALEARLQNPAALGETRIVAALLAVRSGETLGDWFKVPHAAPFLQKEQENFILARQMIIQSKFVQALALLQPALDDAVRHGRVRSQVEALCLMALAVDDLPKAAELLAQALTIGQEKGFRRLFLDEGARVASLLRKILPSLNNRLVNLYAAALLHLYSPNANSDQLALTGLLALVEPLSHQEIRVLRLLSAGLSNGDIASELFISTNTVKTHVKSIYRKLNVNSREAARVMIKELKIL